MIFAMIYSSTCGTVLEYYLTVIDYILRERYSRHPDPDEEYSYAPPLNDCHSDFPASFASFRSECPFG
jgi:hypothetical protein